MSANMKKTLSTIALILAVITVDKQLGLTEKVAVMIPGGAV